MDTEKIFCMFVNNIIYYIGLNNDIEHTEILILYTKKKWLKTNHWTKETLRGLDGHGHF